MSAFSLTRSVVGSVFSLVLVFGLFGCGEKEPVAQVEQVPVHIHNGQECELCGMIINQFPGPKGQLFTRGSDRPLAFCSTRDLFAYALQPEHSHRIQNVFVQDVSSASWEDMSNATYVDAKTAYYVIGHQQLGAMGPTLAAFSSESAAQQFADHFGGELKRYEEIDQSLINSMNHMEMADSHAGHMN